MKKILCTVLLTLAASWSATTYAGTPVSPSELPEAVRTFITAHFPGDEVRKAEKEQGRRGSEYEVDLTSGAEIDFRDNGDWKEIKAARGSAVPAAIVPEAIAAHVAANFKDRSIVEISRKRGGFELELSDGTELKLTKDAKPLTDRQEGKRGSRGNRGPRR